jgi:hypothetical protein
VVCFCFYDDWTRRGKIENLEKLLQLTYQTLAILVGGWGLERIQDHPANRIGELMPWAYQAMVEEQKAEIEAKKGA